MNYRHVIFGILLLASAALFAPGCRKIEPVVPEVSESPETPEDPEVPLVFNAVADSTMTKAVTNKAMGSTYDKNESFVAYAGYSENPFTASSCSYYWNSNGLKCSYNDETYKAWTPSTIYYWPKTGYLTFQAYSPAIAPGLTSVDHDWSNGFTFNDFTVRSAGEQYDLLYTERVENCQRANYTIIRGDGYDDDPNYTFIYNGINLAFKHALSLIEVQTSSSLGSNASLKYYVQSIKLINAYDNGTFTQSTIDPATGAWDVNTTVPMVSYDVLNKYPDWQLVPGADEVPVSVNPAQTLMLLPQELNRDRSDTLDETTDAYLEVIYKEGETGELQTDKLPLTEPWEPGKKYIYQLVFSNYIEFNAYISPWGPETVGSHTIII